MCEEKRRTDYFPGWVERYLYLLNSSWLPTNLYFSCLWTNFYFSCLWEKKGGRFIFLVGWKGTCISSTLAGCQLIFISSHTWLIRKERTMTSRWKRTCTSSTLGKQLRCSLVSNFWWVRCLRKKTNGLFLSCIFKVNIFLTEKLLLKQQCNKIASILTVRTYDLLSYKLFSTNARTCLHPTLQSIANFETIFLIAVLRLILAMFFSSRGHGWLDYVKPEIYPDLTLAVDLSTWVRSGCK